MNCPVYIFAYIHQQHQHNSVQQQSKDFTTSPSLLDTGAALNQDMGPGLLPHPPARLSRPAHLLHMPIWTGTASCALS